MIGTHALIVGAKSKTLQDIGAFMYKQGFGDVSYAFSAGEAKRILSMRQTHMVILNIPLSDDPRLQILYDMRYYTEPFVLMIGKEDVMGILYEYLEEVKGIVLQKPLNPGVFAHTVRLAKNLIERDYQSYNLGGKDSGVATDSYILQAKKILMEKLHMTEPQAHRYIQKMAMNVRMGKEQLAKIVVESYT